MKKLIIIILLLLSVTTAFTQPKYREQIGAALGTINGLSYKCYGGNSQHFVFQLDLYWQWGYMPEGVRYDYSITGNSRAFQEQTYSSTSPSVQYQAAMSSFSFMYQGVIPSNASGTWNWYAGGGFALGMSYGYGLDDISYTFRHNREFRPWLKINEHAIAGIEYIFANTPLSLGIDLRPAIAQNVQIKGIGYNYDELSLLNFDWAANLTVRYCFNNKRKTSE